MSDERSNSRELERRAFLGTFAEASTNRLVEARFRPLLRASLSCCASAPTLADVAGTGCFRERRSHEVTTGHRRYQYNLPSKVYFFQFLGVVTSLNTYLLLFSDWPASCSLCLHGDTPSETSDPCTRSRIAARGPGSDDTIVRRPLRRRRQIALAEPCSGSQIRSPNLEAQ